mmetsp:Transcript_17571/g.38027  ORF Transcript_17571/g.38027 Transcript_17571/m.38027 type:complete len:233 (+) Transcript_17571:74-772(+)
MLKSFAISLLLASVAAETPKALGRKDLNTLFMPLSSISVADDAEGGTCNKNGGGMQSFEGTCDSRNYTWTPQCNTEERDGQCITTANSCGCQVIMSEDGHSSAVGSGSIKGCANACVAISDDVPLDRTCQASGSAVSWDGSCDSRGYTFTSACAFAEDVDGQQNPTTCKITASYCGCLWWEEGSKHITGLEAGSRHCDACAAHGYPLSSAPGIGSALNAFAAAVVTAAWFVL